MSVQLQQNSWDKPAAVTQKHLRAKVRTGVMSPLQERHDEYASVEKQEIRISLESKCYGIAEAMNWLLSGRLDELQPNQRLILKDYSGSWT